MCAVWCAYLFRKIYNQFSMCCQLRPAQCAFFSDISGPFSVRFFRKYRISLMRFLLIFSLSQYCFFLVKFLIFFCRNHAICAHFVVCFENIIFLLIINVLWQSYRRWRLQFWPAAAETFSRKHWIFYKARHRRKKFVFI